MRYDFDSVLDRRGTNSEKWDFNDRVFGRADILPMWVADMDFAAPLPVMEAIARRAEHGVYGYTGVGKSYYDSVVGWVERRHGWRIDPSWILSTPGVVPGLAISVLAFAQPGDGVVVQSPVYPPFFRVVESNGRVLMVNQYSLDGDRYTFDWGDLEAKLNRGPKLLLLCSPANPVGRVWTRSELCRVAEMCMSHGVTVISDEIHSDIVYPWAKHVPFSSLNDQVASNSVTFIAPSKTFNIAGLAASVAIIPDPALRSRFEKVLRGLGLGDGNLFGVTGLEAAYTYGDDWLDQAMAYLEGNLKYMTEFFAARAPEVRVMPPEGTYVIWLDFRELGLAPSELRRLLVDKARVGLSDGPMFGPGGAGFQRINIACPRSVLCEGLTRIEGAISRLKDR
ncbi:MAG: PatB family C-S lyase [Clostridia bacterium]|nr:PatB family C-S lyase [Clostridia bacterium]